MAVCLDATEGLVKGPLATVQELNQRTVVIKLANSESPSRAIWPIPCVCFEFEPPSLPFKIRRYQIPLRLAWAATVHRIQGDDLDRVVVDMRDAYIAHDQLHIATSRGHSRHETRYLVNREDIV
jgi:hypothetical protein